MSDRAACLFQALFIFLLFNSASATTREERSPVMLCLMNVESEVF